MEKHNWSQSSLLVNFAILVAVGFVCVVYYIGSATQSEASPAPAVLLDQMIESNELNITSEDKACQLISTAKLQETIDTELLAPVSASTSMIGGAIAHHICDYRFQDNTYYGVQITLSEYVGEGFDRQLLWQNSKDAQATGPIFYDIPYLGEEAYYSIAGTSVLLGKTKIMVNVSVPDESKQGQLSIDIANEIVSGIELE